MSDFSLHAFAPTAAAQKKAVAIGFFDGVHRGHRFVFEELCRRAQAMGESPWAVTFDVHPFAVIAPERQPLLLTTLDEKIEALRSCGLDGVVVLHYDRKMADFTAERFMRHVLHEALDVERLLVGHDHRFGRPVPGDGFEHYRKIGDSIGISVEACSQMPGETDLSSSAIRALLEAGEVQAAGYRLGRPYALTGTVVHGFQNGRKLGFPTANLDLLSAEKVIPHRGSYATLAGIDGKQYPAMTNIGQRPTLDNGNQVTIETHLLDFDGDLYGRQLEVQFVERLRDERKFDNLQVLEAQLNEDAQQVRRYF